jgi:hypothetical protein
LPNALSYMTTCTSSFPDYDDLDPFAEAAQTAVASAQKPALDSIPAAAAAAAAGLFNAGKPPFDSLPADVIQQLRSDGTRDQVRTLDEAQQVYENLPDSLDNLTDLRAVINSKDYELSHHIPHSEGGANTADNVSYMPTHTNRSMGARHPSANELESSSQAVENEGYIGHEYLIDTATEYAACATAPVGARLTGTGVKLLGGIVRSDEEALNEALAELPGQVKQGAVDGVTRGVPAAIGGSLLGPVGAIGGFVASDFVEAAMSDNDNHRNNKILEGSLKAGLGVALYTNPPLAICAGAGWLVGKFFNCW